MINKNELRIGNWVYATDVLGMSQVLELRYGVCGIDGLDLAYKLDYDELTPILITPQVLDKFEFTFLFGKYRIGDFIIEYAGSHCQYIHNGYCGEPFQYLHQLQNFYFAITGKELNHSPQSSIVAEAKNS